VQCAVIFIGSVFFQECGLDKLLSLLQACTTQIAPRAKLINIISPQFAKVYFVVVWKKFWKDS